MTDALITPELIRWARERYRLSADTVAERVKVTPSKFRAWEEGVDHPTLRQAQTLAQRLNIPFGYLFLSNPPSERLPLPDLRTKTGTPPRSPSPDFSDLLSDVLRKQRWYRDYLENQNAQPIPFIGRFTIKGNKYEIATDIRKVLGVNDDMRRNCKNWEQFLRELIHRAEAAGVLVLRSGIVENNNNRRLDVGEFRGFAIVDSLAPLVFINGRDAKAAQIFTLVHELAHLWIGESGISNPDYMQRSSEQQNRIDRFCDEVAAETLLPNEDFLSKWQNEKDIQENLHSVAAHYRVSAFVVLRRAYDNDKFTSEDYRKHYQELIERQKPKTSEGGDFYANLLSRNGNTLTVTLLIAAGEGRVPYRDAARLLNIKVKTLVDSQDKLIMSGISNV